MPEIIPRWEWRTFGHHLPNADAVFETLEPSAVAESDETYFLSPASTANVKIRDDLIDIKVLREVDAAGVEGRGPVLERPFPLAADDLATVLDSIGIARTGARADGDTSLEQFLALVDANPQARTVPVHKGRGRYTVNDCMAERSEVQAGGRTSLTIAVESTDRP